MVALVALLVYKFCFLILIYLFLHKLFAWTRNFFKSIFSLVLNYSLQNDNRRKFSSLIIMNWKFKLYSFSATHFHQEKKFLSYDMWIPGYALHDSDGPKDNNNKNKQDQDQNPIHFLFHIRVIWKITPDKKL